MSAAAHQLDDEPIDSAEGPMSPAGFEIIQHAHAVCNHAPAVDLTVDPVNSELSNAQHVALLPHAIRILSAHRRAGELVREMKQRGEFSDLAHVMSEVNETDEVEFVPDWQQVAADAWASEGWAQAAKEYQFARMRR